MKRGFNMTVNKTLYYVVEKDIKDKIQRGEYKAGDMLPTESEMCAQYNVSRVTVRKAIEGLIEDGILERSFSKTPRVKQTAVPRNINKMGGLSEDLKRSGIMCSTFILKAELMEPNDSIAEKMNLEEDEHVYLLERLRYANGQPLCYQKLYLKASLCPNLNNENLANKSIYQVLEQKYGLKISHCEQQISACSSSYRICALLELKEATPMLKVCNTGFLEDGTCFEHSDNYYVGENYQVSVILTR